MAVDRGGVRGIYESISPSRQACAAIPGLSAVSIMLGAAITVWQAGACAGLGAALLKLIGLGDALPWSERLLWSFALGFGCLGWIMFTLGVFNLFSPALMAVTLASGCAGLFCLGRWESQGQTPMGSLRPVEWLLVACIVAVGAGDVVEALAPPVDADSLAYHFELPRRFLESGGLFFVPRAVDGGIPLLSQMTYVSALGLGGEHAMTLWTGFSGWTAAGLLYVLCRRHLKRSWALAGVLLFASTPAVIYAAGAGQVEIRMAMFTMVAAFSAASAMREKDLRWALLAGIAAGFAAGSKYTGLLLVPAVGLVCILGAGWFRRGAVCAAGVLIAGCQWYVWNAINSGDPLFPMLYPLIGYPQNGIWDVAHHEALQQIFFDLETPLPRSIWNFVALPFIATLNAEALIEAGRTGLGPWGLLVLPLALLSGWKFRRRLLAHPLMPITICLLILYSLWFFTGSSQRVRHLLPAYPLFLIIVLVATQRWAAAMDMRGVLAGACLLTSGLQIPIQALFTQAHIRHILSGENREAFFARLVPSYAAVPWINDNLSPAHNRIAVHQRQLLYVIDPPTYNIHPLLQASVNVWTDSRDPARFAKELAALDISHVLIASPKRETSSAPPNGGLPYLVSALEKAGCAGEVYQVTGIVHASRTVPELRKKEQTQRVLELRLSDCPLGQ